LHSNHHTLDRQFRYFIKLSYNGGSYHGWQIQENAPSIQAEVNKALSTIFRNNINVSGCGRTDTGVHAREFYAHFDLDQNLNKNTIYESVKKLNGILPKDIAIQKILPVKTDAHARFDALKRTYIYQLILNKDPFINDKAYHYVFGSPDLDKMNRGASIIREYDDFTSFSKLHTQVKTNICKIYDIGWTRDGNLLIFKISADRFLRNMVRAIVGTLIDCGRDKISEEQLRKIIQNKNRSDAGVSVPAQGLFLDSIEYPAGIFLDNN